MADRRDWYQTLVEEVRASIKVQRSEFIGISFPLGTADDFESRLREIVREFHDARHHCWARRAFEDSRIQGRSSDAGEPAGTAGKPMLLAIEGEDLVNVGLVVVRYFGGIKLGTGGLARAYRDAAIETLSAGVRKTVYWYDRFEIIVPWEALNWVYQLISPPDILLVSEEFETSATFTLDIRKSLSKELEGSLSERGLQFRKLRS